MNTKLSIEEIEWGFVNHDGFSYLKDLFITNVSMGYTHELDLARLTKSGYLYEYEIKRSWNDFLADFKKIHKHSDDKIEKFYYIVPISISEKCKTYIVDNQIECDGIYIYDENAKFVFERLKTPSTNNGRKLFLEERFDLLRYSVARLWKCKKKIIDLKK